MTPDAVLQIENVHILPRDETRLRGSWIDSPKKGAEFDIYSMELMGWALGRESRVVAIEYVHAGMKLGTAPVDRERPDIAQAFPDAPHGLHSGFRTSLNMIPLPLRTDVLIQAVLADNERAPLAVITVQRKPVVARFQPQILPLLVTTLGRTGSTWLVRVLGEHPRLTAYRAFEYEPRMLRYWLALLKAGSGEASYARALAGDLGNGDWWGDSSGGGTHAGATLKDPPIHRWFGRTNVEETAAFAGRRVEGFYREVARTQGKQEAKFFVEKSWPEFFVPQMTREIYPGTKDIILVRDFRDGISSVLRLNRKRGYATFGRELVETDRKFVQHVRGHAVRLLEYWREHKDAFLMRYEDLILRPHPTLTAALDAIGLDSRPEIIQAMLERAAAVPLEIRQRHSTSANPAASIGRWREDLDDALKAECAEAFGDVLEQFGYTP